MSVRVLKRNVRLIAKKSTPCASFNAALTLTVQSVVAEATLIAKIIARAVKSVPTAVHARSSPSTVASSARTCSSVTTGRCVGLVEELVA